MPVPRRLSDPEWGLVRYLAGNEFSSHREDWPAVTAMDDGGMGSLRFVGTKDRRLGHVVGECSFVDADGVEVFAALNSGDDWQPFELDIWKVDFEPLIRIPEPEMFKPPAPGRDTD